MKTVTIVGILSITLMVLSINSLYAANDDKIASVNGSSISKNEFLFIIEQVKKQYGNQKIDDKQLAVIKQQIVEGFITSELLYQESQKQGVKIDDKVVNEQFEAFKKRFSQNDFNLMLKQQNTSEESIKTQIKKNVVVKNFIEKNISTNIKVSDDDIKKFYDSNPNFFKMPEQLGASHILIKVDPKAEKAEKDKALQKIKDAQNKIKKGEDFAATAKSVSQCPSAASGGDLGYFGRNQMVKPFEDAVFGLKNIGDMTDIVETIYGYHLIKLTGKKQSSTVPFESSKEKIKQHLSKMKIEQEVKSYSEKLKKNAKIEKFL